jgi:outer membrane receptor for ferrienterochelin and colicin
MTASIRYAGAQTGEIRGTVLDRTTGEAMTGANVVVEQLSAGTTAGLDGSYRISVRPGVYTVKVSFIAYNTVALTGVTVEEGKTVEVNVAMEEAAMGMEEVVVSEVRKMNSEASMISAMKVASVVMNGVSAQQISRTQDRNAAEVIRRIPGISVIDERFVIARGLSQRYNNVWVNNSAVPSAESDARAFSFDMIPASQMENMMIVKSPTPELPADFTGGFIRIATKSIPAENSAEASYSTGVNTETHFRQFLYNRGSATDFLGFDNGLRNGNTGDINDRIDNDNAVQVNDVTRTGFNNDWNVGSRRPAPDQRLTLTVNRRFAEKGARVWGLIAALNYSIAHRASPDMKNNRYGIYNIIRDEPEAVYNYSDDQYNTDVRMGGLFNLTFIAGDKSRFEFRNIIHQLGRDRYTFREGWQNISSLYRQEKAEYLYSSRTSYSGQFAGIHTLSESAKLDWTVGYAYANKRQPDRRIINRRENDFGTDDAHFGQMMIDQNEISRGFIRLNEQIASTAVNFVYTPEAGGNFRPTLKTGLYGEFRSRQYHTRDFYYRYRREGLPADFIYRNVTAEILQDENYGTDRLYIYEESDFRDNYFADNRLLAAYAGVSLPVKRMDVAIGARFEHYEARLTTYTTIADRSRQKIYAYPQTGVFPSVNAAYRFSDEHLLRTAYGMSVNRQEFRELSPSVFYDFELFSDIKGNPDLREALIQNADLRYEWYPAAGEMISVALFYKYFIHPIEWTYRDAGGSYTYTFENALSANNYGVEADIKKNLDAIGLPQFSLSLNASLIRSRVKFDGESLEHDRPMQGQSPWLVNAGAFYRARNDRWTGALLYNIIGQRIVGIGKTDVSNGASINNDIPDMYEMPRHALDLTVCRKFGKHIEIGVSLKDILAQDVVFKQFPRFYDAAGNLCSREQITKQFKPGRNISVSIKIK